LGRLHFVPHFLLIPSQFLEDVKMGTLL